MLTHVDLGQWNVFGARGRKKPKPKPSDCTAVCNVRSPTYDDNACLNCENGGGGTPYAPFYASLYGQCAKPARPQAMGYVSFGLRNWGGGGASAGGCVTPCQAEYNGGKFSGCYCLDGNNGRQSCTGCTQVAPGLTPFAVRAQAAPSRFNTFDSSRSVWRAR